MFKLFEDCDLSCDLLFSYELTIHFFDGDLFAIENIFAFVNFAEGTLSDAIFLCEDIISHLNFNLLVHSMLMCVSR